MFRYEDQQLIWMALTGVFLLLGWLSFMMRQHYALMNQNRIVRLEMRLRYYILTQKRLETIEQKLSFEQIAALRFASDDELISLIQQAVDKKLSVTNIKKSIRNWEPDYMRV